MTSDFNATNTLFALPEGVIYLEGIRLARCPVRCRPVSRGDRRGMGPDADLWLGSSGLDGHAALGDRIAGLIGAKPGSVVIGNTLSIGLSGSGLGPGNEPRSPRHLVRQRQFSLRPLHGRRSGSYAGAGL